MMRTIHLLLALSLTLASGQLSVGLPVFDTSFLMKTMNDVFQTTTSTASGLLKAFSDVSNDIVPEDPINITDPDRNRNVVEIIRSRGFEAEEYDVTTKDGYILTIQRIVNPLIKPEDRVRMKPVIMQHGLMSSSVDWVINSLHVRPTPWPNREAHLSETINFNETDSSLEIGLTDTQEHPNSLGFYLANRGYDVFLANSRGNVYGQKHVRLSKFQPKFWSFTFDEQIAFDLPDTIKFVLKKTNKSKLGYVGHSQGTLIMFGLLSEQPNYADIVEPVIALAPVAYCRHVISPVKYFSIYAPAFQYVDMVFAPPNFAVKYLAPLVCKPEMIMKEICANILFLGIGFDWDELDNTRVNGYLGHMPSGTSVKNIAHYGQMVMSGKFAKFSHGILGNIMQYGSSSPPEYDLGKIRSKSLVLFVADNDWLASPQDVADLRASLKVKPYAVYNISEEKPKWNHIDFVYAKHAGEIINPKIEKVFKDFDK